MENCKHHTILHQIIRCYLLQTVNCPCIMIIAQLQDKNIEARPKNSYNLFFVFNFSLPIYSNYTAFILSFHHLQPQE
ncbi:hypothetical protein AQUCO_01400915v1 [Aquilegia coerulea]|uniref:Uncharacterized protein n=1 Tax=Aquilegia coerulea TaxID=218851 RepID=A0A2G5DYR6_AQUCA|nr:hypothetical protein AQUCO_01400915v1 [Aquilegia coerulea]